MKIIDKTTLQNGTEIQLEDWTEHDTESHSYGFQIGAYPIAKNTGKYRWVEGGKKFRITIASNVYMGYYNDDVVSDYQELKKGEKSLDDLAKHFWNGEKDMWYLGMEVECKNY